MIGGVVIAFIFEWNFGFALLFVTPFAGICCGLVFVLQFGTQMGTPRSEVLQEKMVSDYVGNYSTVASLANEEAIICRYFANSRDRNEEISYTLTYQNIMEALLPGFANGFSVGGIFMSYFIMIMICAHNVRHNHGFEDQTIGLSAFFYSFVPISFMMVNIPDFGRSFRSAKKIIRITQCIEEGKPESPIVDGKEEMTEEIASGDIEFINITFKYPTVKEDILVLQNFNLTIKKNTSVGLVGESG